MTIRHSSLVSGLDWILLFTGCGAVCPRSGGPSIYLSPPTHNAFLQSCDAKIEVHFLQGVVEMEMERGRRMAAGVRGRGIAFSHSHEP